MFTNHENFPFAAKAFFEFQLVRVNALAYKALLTGEKFNSLNIAATKALTAEFVGVMQQLLSVKDPQALLALATVQAQANADKVMFYVDHLRNLISTIQTDFTQAAEVHINATHSKVTALTEQVTKNSPATSINTVAMLKSVIRNANAGHEQLRIDTKPVLEQIASDAVKDTDQLSQAVETASNKTS